MAQEAHGNQRSLGKVRQPAGFLQSLPNRGSMPARLQAPYFIRAFTTDGEKMWGPYSRRSEAYQVACEAENKGLCYRWKLLSEPTARRYASFRRQEAKGEHFSYPELEDADRCRR